MFARSEIMPTFAPQLRDKGTQEHRRGVAQSG